MIRGEGIIGEGFSPLAVLPVCLVYYAGGFWVVRDYNTGGNNKYRVVRGLSLVV